MMVDDELAAFDEAVMRYLDGCLEGAEFEQLQDHLRRSAISRRRFLDLCRQAHECSEVTDARGLPEAGNLVEFEAPSADEPSRQPAFWRRFGRKGVAAAAVALVIGAGTVLIRSSPEEGLAHAGATSVDLPPDEIFDQPVSQATRPVSLLEPQPGGFALSSRVQPVVWDEIEPEVALRDEPHAGWLDGIGLLVVYQPIASSDPDDIQL